MDVPILLWLKIRLLFHKLVTLNADNASYSEAQIKIEGSCVYLMNTNDRVIPIFATKDAHWDSN